MALGSFFEVVLDRLPRGESLLWPPPHGRARNRVLPVDELVPVISYLAQHGRCRACDTPIGRGVPIREALSGLALGLPWAIVGCSHPVVALSAGIVALLLIWIVRGVTQGRATAV